MGARRAADVDLPAPALDGHRADVLDHGLGAVARAARRRHLDLAGAFDPLEAALDLDAKPRAVPDPVAAEVRPDAGLAGAE